MKIRTTSSKASPKVIAVFLAFLGLAFTAMGSFATMEQLRVRDFLPVRGTVTDTSIDSESDSDGTSYYPEVSFRYQVEGKTYESGELRLVRIGGRQSKARAKIANYPTGTEVDAWYDPEDPSVAVIEDDVSWLTLIFVVTGLAMLVGSVFMFRYRPRAAADDEA